MAPSTGSRVACPWVADASAVLLANTHLSNEASEPVGVPSKMYSNPGSGGGATYWALAHAGATASPSTAMQPAATPVRPAKVTRPIASP
jgi:hypothetical protein